MYTFDVMIFILLNIIATNFEKHFFYIKIQTI